MVKYEVLVKDRLTGELVTDHDTYVSIRVTDDSVFTKIEEKKQPPSFAAQVYLEHEVFNNDYQFYYAGEYLEHLWNDKVEGTNNNIELLLWVQEWRHGKFYLPWIENFRGTFNELDDKDKVLYENLYGFVFD